MEDTYLINSNNKKGYEIAKDYDSVNMARASENSSRRGRVGKECSQTLTTQGNMGVIYNKKIRRLTPKECFRLQGVKDNDIKNLIVSNSQAYKIAGNAISVNVMQYLLKSIYKKELKNKKTSLFEF
ncbi:DNA cytosine methyltransferase [Aliarcobacter butzleri]|uniref:DNA cytosine methyltransferase n=1 Tax=Aliarcobacter butzleri TaxID=28197 RepID=UPI002B24506B|nr:DNA cytosine methyltransferase [Aliarcobacter butzleri]